MATERQLKILYLIVNDYVKAGHPISSQTLLEKHNLKMSSATIRNEMVILEEEKYIEKAYKSAGRVPTNKGYEHYLKDINENSKSIEFLKKKIEKILEDRKTNIDDTIIKALSIINDATNTLSISKEDNSNVKLEDLKVYDIGNDEFIVLLDSSDGKVVNNKLSVEGLKFEEIETAINIFADRLRGTAFSEIEKKAEKLKDIISINVKGLENKLQEVIKIIFGNIINTFETYQGTSSLVKADKFSTKHLQKILEIVENKSIWKILKQNEKIRKGTTQISLGIDELENVSIVYKDINSNQSKRSLTIVGSKQQDYGKLFALLDFLEEKIKGE